MRSTLALTLLAAALVAGGCKKSDKAANEAPKADKAADPKVAEPKPAEPKVAEPTPAPAAVDPGAPAAAGADTLKLAMVPPKVGDKQTKIDDIGVVFSLDAKGKKIDVETIEHKEQTQEVLESDGKEPTKIRVSYSKLSEVQKMGGQDKAKPQPLDGKTFIVWTEGGVIKATTDDGKPVTDEELALLAKKNDDLGKGDPLTELMAGRTWKIGETYNLTADDLAKLKARDKTGEKPVPVAMSFTLESFDAKEARFAMVMVMDQSMGATDKLNFDLKGFARIEQPSSRALEMNMSGPVKGAVKGMATEGTMSAKSTYSY